jgi:hypothetical protein
VQRGFGVGVVVVVKFHVHEFPIPMYV